MTITNDGATILKLLEVEHPAAKVLCELADLQDKEVGDGTTSVVSRMNRCPPVVSLPCAFGVLAKVLFEYQPFDICYGCVAMLTGKRSCP